MIISYGIVLKLSLIKQIGLILVWTPEQARSKEYKNMNMIIRKNKESRIHIEEGDPTAEKTCCA